MMVVPNNDTVAGAIKLGSNILQLQCPSSSRSIFLAASAAAAVDVAAMTRIILTHEPHQLWQDQQQQTLSLLQRTMHQLSTSKTTIHLTNLVCMLG